MSILEELRLSGSEEYATEDEEKEDIERCLRKLQQLRVVEIPEEAWPEDMAKFIILRCSPHLQKLKFNSLIPLEQVKLLIDWSPVERIIVGKRLRLTSDDKFKENEWHKWVAGIRGFVNERSPRVAFYCEDFRYARIKIRSEDKPHVSERPTIEREKPVHF